MKDETASLRNCGHNIWTKY